MYAVITGEEGHFAFKRCSSRTEAEQWLQEELFLYRLCFLDGTISVLTNKDFYSEFCVEFPERKNYFMHKRYAQTLNNYIDAHDQKSRADQEKRISQWRSENVETD